MIHEALQQRGWTMAREESDGEPALWTRGNPVAMATEAVLFYELMNSEAARKHHAAVTARLLQAANAAWHLCQSLLAVREGATDELIVEVRGALHSAIVLAGIEHFSGMPAPSSPKTAAEG